MRQAGHLAAFAPFIGHDWKAPLPGGPLTDTVHFEWVLGDQFVRNIHKVRSSDGETVYEGEAIYAWDSRAEHITWWYWNSTGGYITGTVTVDSDGSLVADGDNRGPTNQIDRTHARMRMGNGQWTMATWQEKDGKRTDEPPRLYRPVK